MPIPEFQDLTSALRRARRHSVASTPCISEPAMAAFVSGRVHGEERTKVIAHLTECAPCRAEFAGVSSALADPGIAREVAALSLDENAGGPGRFARRAAVAGLAAALVLFVVTRVAPRGDDVGALRDQHGIDAEAPRIVAPDGIASDTTAFRWSASPGAQLYRVTVFSADGVVVWDAETADTLIAPPKASPFARDVRYLWRVEARTDFDRWVSSSLVEFRTRGASSR